jgi:hypothetical protein
VISQLSLIDDLAGLAEERKNRINLKELLEINAVELSDMQDKREMLAGNVGRLAMLSVCLQRKWDNWAP